MYDYSEYSGYLDTFSSFGYDQPRCAAKAAKMPEIDVYPQNSNAYHSTHHSWVSPLLYKPHDSHNISIYSIMYTYIYIYIE